MRKSDSIFSIKDFHDSSINCQVSLHTNYFQHTNLKYCMYIVGYPIITRCATAISSSSRNPCADT